MLRNLAKKSSPRVLSYRRITSSTQSTSKREGDISSAFASLSNSSTTLPPRFSKVKASLLRSQQPEKLTQSFHSLLKTIAAEISVTKALGSAIIPNIDYTSIANKSVPASFTEAHKRTGVAIIKDVITQKEALAWLESIRSYIRANPSTKAFPKDNPAVYELYWSKAQILARSDPRMLNTMKFLMSHWHSGGSAVSTLQPITYADCLRIRPPGDAAFALGPHVDGGSCERWETSGYGGPNGTYSSIFQGDWRDFDAFDASKRLGVVSDLYQGAGACSAFRMYQGWLALSSTGPNEGTLKVNPLFSRATAYFLLRPFFTPRNSDTQRSGFLDPENWQLEDLASLAPVLQGASPGHGQELSSALHPHLDLKSTMVSLPRVQPGDYIAWHCDTIHAVDTVHQGKDHSSVLYIPVCPLTMDNVRYLSKQRECFESGVPSPDFPGGTGESEHSGRATRDTFSENGVLASEGRRAMGLESLDIEMSETDGGRELFREANRILGF